MKDSSEDLNDDLRPEYDLRSLRVRKVGPERQALGGTMVPLAPDVAKMFPDATSVNEALRFLIRVAKSQTTKITG